MASTIKVDNVQNQPGNNLINRCSATTTVGSGAGNTINVDGATVTLGRCGGTVALASGATQTGFGAAGAVDWITTPQTGTVTAATGKGYFVNTTSGGITVNLPAGAAGSIVAVADYTRTFGSNSCTIAPNGSEKIGGAAEDALLTVDGQSATFVYVDATEGWINVQETQTSVTGRSPYITATVSGSCNTLATCGDYKIATFKNPGTFCVSCAAVAAPNNVVDYLVVAGGGGGNWSYGGGGGGGFRFYATTPVNPQSGPGGPINNYPSGTSITVANGAYPITVGAAGAGSPTGPAGVCNTAGGNSIFSSITSAGGGKGGNYVFPTPTQPGTGGGSGGGGGSWPGPGANPGGTGNSPPVSPPQGNNGGAGYHQSCDVGGGGGGAMAAGTNAAPPYLGGNGGAGAGLTGFGTTGQPSGGQYYFSGGAGGGGQSGPGCASYSNKGIGGAGDGKSPGIPSTTGVGTANTGGGGGGGWGCQGKSNGGSGIVVIRYKFQ